MPNDIANNMADTIHQLEEDRIMLNTQLTDLQLAYNEQMLKLKKAKRLLKSATNVLNRFIQCDEDYCSECIKQRQNCDYDDRFKWLYADEALALIGEDGEQNV